MSLDSAVNKNSIVRVIDVFVDLLDLKQIGFIIKGQIKNSAPAYHAVTNLKAIWLIKGCRPSYKTIADFRKDNPKALEKVFRIHNRFLLGEDLFDTKTVAIDGSKFQGQNSTKNNYNEKKVKSFSISLKSFSS